MLSRILVDEKVCSTPFRICRKPNHTETNDDSASRRSKARIQVYSGLLISQRLKRSERLFLAPCLETCFSSLEQVFIAKKCGDMRSPKLYQDFPGERFPARFPWFPKCIGAHLSQRWGQEARNVSLSPVREAEVTYSYLQSRTGSGSALSSFWLA